MLMRALDGNGDWTFGQGKQNYLAGQQAVAQNVSTRLKSFKNNCFFDMNAGIDWMTYLGFLGQEQAIVLNVRAIILQSFGIVSVNSVVNNFNRNSRNLVLTYSANSIFTSNFTQNLQVVNGV